MVDDQHTHIWACKPWGTHSTDMMTSEDVMYVRCDIVAHLIEAAETVEKESVPEWLHQMLQDAVAAGKDAMGRHYRELPHMRSGDPYPWLSKENPNRATLSEDASDTTQPS